MFRRARKHTEPDPAVKEQDREDEERRKFREALEAARTRDEAEQRDAV